MPTIDEISYVYNALPTASIIVNANSPHFTIVAANSAFLESTRTVLSTFIGKNFFDHFLVESDSKTRSGKLLKAFERVLKLKQACEIKSYKYAYQSSAIDLNAPIYWRINIYPLFDQFGEIEYIVQSLEDVTESKITHEKLLASESRLKNLVDVQKAAKNALKSNNELYNYVNKATNDAIYDWDILQNHLEWGEAFSRIFGYPPHEGQFPIEKWGSMVHPEDIEATNESLTHLLNNKNKIHWAIEYRLKKANDEYAFVQENGYVLRNKEGVAIRMIGVLQDITQRMEHELKIKEHLERYNAVSKATSDTIWDYNLLTNEVIWNSDGKDIFGYKQAKSTYEWWREHVHPDDLPKIVAIIQRCKTVQQSRWTGEYRFRCADGKYKSILDRGFLIFDDQGVATRMIGAMQDITERVNYIQTIEQRNIRLRDIAWAQAHLVRPPLARIMGIVQLLSDEETNADDDRKQLLSYLDVSAKELDEIVKNIIDKSRI